MFREVWQTWSFVPRETILVTKGGATSAVEVGSGLDVRKEVQMKRLKKCMSIWDLSEKVGCSADALSAFERGVDVLDTDILRRIKSVLDR